MMDRRCKTGRLVCSVPGSPVCAGRGFRASRQAPAEPFPCPTELRCVELPMTRRITSAKLDCCMILAPYRGFNHGKTNPTCLKAGVPCLGKAGGYAGSFSGSGCRT
jgi:hypothetical protein